MNVSAVHVRLWLLAITSGVFGACASSPEPGTEPEPQLRSEIVVSDTIVVDSIGLPFTGRWAGRPEVRSTVPYIERGTVERWEFDLWQSPDGVVRGMAVLQSQLGTRVTHEVAGIVDSNTVFLTLSCRCLANGTVKYQGTLDGSEEIRGSVLVPGPNETPVEMILLRQMSNLTDWPLRKP